MNKELYEQQGIILPGGWGKNGKNMSARKSSTQEEITEL